MQSFCPCLILYTGAAKGNCREKIQTIIITMKKTLFIALCLLGTAIIANAQLKVNSDGKVTIATNLNTSCTNLLVVNNAFGLDTSNVGIVGSKAALESKNNIGFLGTTVSTSGVISRPPMCSYRRTAG